MQYSLLQKSFPNFNSSIEKLDNIPLLPPQPSPQLPPLSPPLPPLDTNEAVGLVNTGIERCDVYLHVYQCNSCRNTLLISMLLDTLPYILMFVIIYFILKRT
jgi:hypothetical protein